MKLIYTTALSALVAYARAAEWSYASQPWTGTYCSSTPVQSPIDIETSVSNPAHDQDVIHAPRFIEEHMRGRHAVTINDVDAASTHSLKFNFANPIGSDDWLKCVQVHCHFADSEHKIDGKATFGECHVVCHDGAFGDDLMAAVVDGGESNLSVFGFFIEEDPGSKDNELFQEWIDHKSDRSAYMTNSSTVMEISLPIPDNTENYFRYQGGLTTPTCNPVVRWSVWADTFKISTGQKNQMLSWSAGHLIGNNRGVQPRAGREIWEFGASEHQDDHEMELFDAAGHWHAAIGNQCVGVDKRNMMLKLVDCGSDEDMGGWHMVDGSIMMGDDDDHENHQCVEKVGNKFKCKDCDGSMKQKFAYDNDTGALMLAGSHKCVKNNFSGKLVVGKYCDEKVMNWGK